MAKQKKPKDPPKTPPPVMPVDAASAGDAEAKSLKKRKGGLSTWLTRGQSLGGGTNLG
jgi:hypothetical protein